MSQNGHGSRVVVTGLGTINPLGLTVEETWDSVVNGRTGIARLTHFDPSEHKTQFGGEVKGFDQEEHFGRREARRMDRGSALALAATEQALADTNIEAVDPEIKRRIGVIIGTGIGGVGTTVTNQDTYRDKGPLRVSPHFIPMMLPDTTPAKISLTWGFCGPNMAIATACASSTNAIGEAARMVQYGGYKMMIAGGTEAALVPSVLAGFNVMGAMSTWNDRPQEACRPFDSERNGFVPGEGAAVVILEELEHALARGAHIYGELIGYGASADAFHITAPKEDGSGAAESMQLAIDRAGIAPDGIDYINAHGTSTVLNDRMETRAIKNVFGESAYDVAISSTKSMHGHLLGGAGALEVTISLLAMKNSMLPPTLNYTTPDPELDLDYVPNTARPKEIRAFMSNSFGFGGHNATLLFRKV